MSDNSLNNMNLDVRCVEGGLGRPASQGQYWLNRQSRWLRDWECPVSCAANYQRQLFMGQSEEGARRKTVSEK